MKRRKKNKKLITVRSLSEIPKFRSEDAERRFWETHDLSTKLWDELYDPVLEQKERKLMNRLKLTDRRK